VSATIRLAPEPQSVAAARRFAAEQTLGLPAELRQTVELCVSELATNSVLHAATSFSVTVSRDGEVRVEVSDDGAGQATPRVPNEREAHGRGLQIVRALADDWGVAAHGARPGKTVWCRFGLASVT
jgi:two-component sensor histidine kinase